jgi:hypothetical protein
MTAQTRRAGRATASAGKARLGRAAGGRGRRGTKPRPSRVEGRGPRAGARPPRSDAGQEIDQRRSSFEEAMRRQASANCDSAAWKRSRLSAARATRITSTPAGTRAWLRRKISRSRRLAALRRTAEPTAAAEATTPTRAGAGRASSAASRRRHHTVNAPRSLRRPCSRTRRKSAARRRCCPGRNRCVADAEGDGRGTDTEEGSRVRSDDGQAFAPFAPAGRQDLAAALGGHAGAKADLACTLFAVRTECRLHDLVEKRGSR